MRLLSSPWRRRAGAAIASAAAVGAGCLAVGTHTAYAATATVAGCTKADLTNAISAAGAGGTVDYIVDCTGGDAVAISGAVTILSSVTIDGNGHAVTLDGGHSGQIINVALNVTLHINQLTFANGSWPDGGAMTISGSIVTISNSTFVDNTASSLPSPGFGGAIDSLAVSAGGTAHAPALTITNSTFDDNTATVGSAIVAAGTTDIVNSTFRGNSASAIAAAGTFTLQNSIIEQSGTADCTGTVTDAGGNLADDASCGFSSAHSRNSVSDTSLAVAALADNGGPAETNALAAGSSAVDFATGCPATDERGVARFDRDESACDAGAYEFQDPAPPTPSATPTPAVTPSAVPVPSTGGTGGTVPPSLLVLGLGLGTAALGFSACREWSNRRRKRL